ncbi:perlucin-like [Ostrea edulis]|uniref:perlucin-like n=1 Tax=Ostrea edulis TaxID=37623 RepID=UPI0024AF651A|nr:perlucin-like [Ostrea edulis]
MAAFLKYLIIWSFPLFLESLSEHNCPSGFVHHGSSCYLFVMNSTSSWIGAANFCKIRHGNLVEIESAEENNFIERELRKLPLPEEKEFWIGASDRIREGEWTWFTTLSPMNFTAWQPGEPNNSDGNENCVIIYAVDFLWNNLGCARRINFICEIRLHEDKPPVGILG